MKQIYHFESHTPPVLTEKILQAEVERRRLRRQTTLLALAAIAAQLWLLLIPLILFPLSPKLAAICFSYFLATAAGGSILILVFIKKRRSILCHF